MFNTVVQYTVEVFYFVINLPNQIIPTEIVCAKRKGSQNKSPCKHFPVYLEYSIIFYHMSVRVDNKHAKHSITTNVGSRPDTADRHQYKHYRIQKNKKYLIFIMKLSTIISKHFINFLLFILLYIQQFKALFNSTVAPCNLVTITNKNIQNFTSCHIKMLETIVDVFNIELIY